MNTPISYPETMRLTYSLRHPEDWSRTIEQLADARDQATQEGLIELLYHPPAARAAVAAVTALAKYDSPLIIEALHHALNSSHASVRLAAIQSLQQRKAQNLAPVVSRLLEREPSWMIRRVAVEFLAANPTDRRWEILKSSTDPHWRVRHALIQILLQWSTSESQTQEIQSRLQAAGRDERTQGVVRYLAYRDTHAPRDALPMASEDPRTWCPFWDWDPAVLAWRLEQMSARERGDQVRLMPRLIGHEDERVRRWAAHTLLRDGERGELVESLRWLDDPRHPAFETVTKLTGKLDPERIEQMAQSLFDIDRPSPGQWIWVLDQIETTAIAEDFPTLGEFGKRAIHEEPRVRSAYARMLCRVMTADRRESLRTLLEDSNADVLGAMLRGIAEEAVAKDIELALSREEWQRLLGAKDPEIRTAAVRVLLGQEIATAFVSHLIHDSSLTIRCLVAKWLVAQFPQTQQIEEWLSQLQEDPSSRVRAAALTVSRAAELLEEPTKETSWLVLERAARLRKTPLWSIAPKPVAAPAQDFAEAPMWLPVQGNGDYATRSLAGLEVSPLGISGHYGLPVRGFQVAMETGVNLMFWEPNYQTLTEFLGRLSPRDRETIHMVVGTFEASPHRIRNDVERALAKLQVERIAVFLLFWTRSWNRVTDSVRAMLDQLQTGGMIATYGLSTHSRPLAVEAMESGWNPVMVRHSAAHRGAETAVFPIAQKQGTSLLTFNNTCYGRLLEAFSSDEELSPADCYRYTLGFDAVTACWSAPATMEELRINLEALHRPELSEERCRRLQEIGERVYEEDSIFRRYVRGV